MPAGESTSRLILRAILIVVAVALVLYVVYLLRRPLSWLVIAAFIAVAVSGPVNVLSRHMRRGFAIAVVYITLLLIPIGLGALLIPSLVNQGEDLANNAPEYAQDVTDFVNENETLRNLNDDYDITAKLQDEAEMLPSKIGDAAGTLRDIGIGFVNSVFAGLTILILSIFMVSGGRRWIERFLETRNPEQKERIGRALDHIGNAVGNYVAGALLQATIAGITSFIVLTILGVPFAAPLALVVFFFDLIPLVGATLAAVLVAVVIAVCQLPGRADRVGDLLDRLPAGGELRDPAPDPAASRSRGAVRRPRRGVVRGHAVRDHRRPACDPGGGLDPDRDPGVDGLPATRSSSGQTTAPPPPSRRAEAPT